MFLVSFTIHELCGLWFARERNLSFLDVMTDFTTDTLSGRQKFVRSEQ